MPAGPGASAPLRAQQPGLARVPTPWRPPLPPAPRLARSLDKASLGELKSFGSPAAEVVQVRAARRAPAGDGPLPAFRPDGPPACRQAAGRRSPLLSRPHRPTPPPPPPPPSHFPHQVVASCMVLTAPGGKIPKDLSWAAGKKCMGNVDAFLKSLLSFDKDNVPVVCVDVCERDYINNAGFRPENIKSKSSAAAGLCAWVINVCKYFRIYQVGGLGRPSGGRGGGLRGGGAGRSGCSGRASGWWRPGDADERKGDARSMGARGALRLAALTVGLLPHMPKCGAPADASSPQPPAHPVPAPSPSPALPPRSLRPSAPRLQTPTSGWRAPTASWRASAPRSRSCRTRWRRWSRGS